MHRLILAALFLLAAGGAAQAACPAVMTDCPNLNANAVNFGGLMTYGGQSFERLIVTQPPQEIYVNDWWATAMLTSASTNNVVLPLKVTLQVNPGIYNYGLGGTGGQHNGAIYGYGKGTNTLPLAGCTPGTNCPGTIQNTAGVIGFAEQGGTGDQFNATTFEAHTPTVPPTGGWLDQWYVLYDDGCSSGKHASFCTGLAIGAQGYTTYSGFGTTNPLAEVMAQGIDRTVTATGYVGASPGYTAAGTTLCLTTVPSAEIYPGATVTGTGVSANTHILSDAPMSPTATPCYIVDVSQLVPAGTAFTIADNWVGFIAQNLTLTSKTRYGFMIGSSNTITAAIDLRYDSTVPLAYHMALQVNNNDIAYLWATGAPRVNGMAVGYTTLASLPVSYNFGVKGVAVFNGGRVDHLLGGTQYASYSADVTAAFMNTGGGSDSAIAITGNASGHSILYIGDNSNSANFAKSKIMHTAADGSLSFWTNLAVREYITSGGVFGFGTSSTPATSARLHLQKTGSALPANTGSTQSAGHLLRLDDNSGVVLDMGGNGASGYWLQGANAGTLSTSIPLLLNPNGGDVFAGGASLAAGATTGFFHFPIQGATPTGTPASTAVSCAWNTATHVLNCYDGASWYKLAGVAGAG